MIYTLRFEMRLSASQTAIAEMADYANATVTVEADGKGVSLTRARRFDQSVVDRAATFGWALLTPPTAHPARPQPRRGHRPRRALPEIEAVVGLIDRLIDEQATGNSRVRSRAVVEALCHEYDLRQAQARGLLADVAEQSNDRFFFEAASVWALADPRRYVPMVNGTYRPSIVRLRPLPTTKP